MKHILLALSLGIFPLSMFAQKEPNKILYDKYVEQNYSQFDYLKIGQRLGWVPRKEGQFKGSFDYFEKMFVGYTSQDSRALEQMKIDGCYYCALEIDYFQTKYNSKYKYVNYRDWLDYCPILYILMKLDDN